MTTPLDIVKIGIRYFIRLVGWSEVAKIVKSEYRQKVDKKAKPK